MYKKKTTHYGIPYISKGEMMEAKEQERAAQIIDNMLYAATFGVDKAVFEDGNYRLNLESDGLYTLSIIPCNGYSFLGIVNYCLFSSTNIKKINNLRSGNKYFIYVFYQNDLSTNPENFILAARTDKIIDSSSLSIHVATIDLTGIDPVIDENPYSKKYSTLVSAHMADDTNPHGRTLYQDVLQVVEKLYINGRMISPYEIIELDLETNKTTYELTFLEKISFVSHINLSKPQNIWFDIEDKKITVNTDGKVGKIKLKVEF